MRKCNVHKSSARLLGHKTMVHSDMLVHRLGKSRVRAAKQRPQTEVLLFAKDGEPIALRQPAVEAETKALGMLLQFRYISAHRNSHEMDDDRQLRFHAVAEHGGEAVDDPHAVQTHAVQEGDGATNAVLAVVQRVRAVSHDLARVQSQAQ